MWPVNWVFAVKTACGVCIFICISAAVYLAAPEIETRYFPVVGKLEILSVKPTGEDDTTSDVEAAFRKIRNCDYLGIAWFRGNREGRFDRVPLVLLRKEGDVSSPNRPVGYQTSGPWRVAIPPEEIRTNSFVELYHACWGPLWVTRTEFYP